jgi:hypothetical protein
MINNVQPQTTGVAAFQFHLGTAISINCAGANIALASASYLEAGGLKGVKIAQDAWRSRVSHHP